MPELTPEEATALSTFAARLSDSFAMALSESLNQLVVLDPPTVSTNTVEEVVAGATSVLQTTCSFPALGNDDCMVVFAGAEAPILADLIQGGDGKNAPINVMDEQMAVLADAMTNVVAGFGNAIGNVRNTVVQLGNCATSLEPLSLPPCFATADQVVQLQWPFHIEGVLDRRLQVLMTPEFALAITPAKSESEVASAAAPDLSAPLGLLDFGLASDGAPVGGQDGGASGAASDGLPRGIDLIMDIPLEVTVELGRVRMLIKDVLALGAGSIVELQRIAGEPVDLLVNGRMVAKGEVVVIDDNFGIRITEIVGQADRVAAMARR
jgi:flagellar motor switch protein FliN/FliY